MTENTIKRTPIEKIKSFHSIMGYLPQKDQINLQKKLKITDDDLKRLSGLEVEQEFIYMIYMLLSCNEIVGFDEGIARLTGVACPDLYVELSKNKRKIMVEIKENNINITKNGIKKHLEFTKKLGADDLYVAVKQNGLWALYSSDYLLKRNPKKINWKDDYLKSKMEEVFDDKTFFMPNGLSFECIYNKNLKLDNASHCENFGCLEHLTIKYKNKAILTVDNKNGNADSICFPLEALITACANSNHGVIKLTNKRTKIVDKLDIANCDGIYMTISNFLLEPVRHTIKPFNEKYDYTSFLKNQYANKQNILKLKVACINCLGLLEKYGYPLTNVKFET